MSQTPTGLNPLLTPLLYPSSIAIVGASEHRAKMGGRCLHYLRKHGYEGEVFPINPKSEQVQGLRAYPSIRNVGRPIEMAILIVEASTVPAVLEECAEAGVVVATVFSSGFAELGSAGTALQQRVRDVAMAGNIRLLGPNSNGLLNTHNMMAGTSNPALEAPLLRGPVSVISQSGGLALGSMLYLGQRQGMGYASVLSTGNEADLDTAELIQVVVDDPETRSIALLLEGIRRPDAFLDAATYARERGVPIVALKLGRSTLGSQFTATHTALLAGEHRVTNAVLRQHGIETVNDLATLYQTAALLATSSTPSAPKLGMISPSGGATIMAADLAADFGLTVPTLSSETQARIASILPGFGIVKNPIDLTAAGVSDPSLFPRCIEALSMDEGVDVVVPILTVAVDYDPFLDYLLELRARIGKPLIPVALGNGLNGEGMDKLARAGVPFFSSLTEAFAALSTASRRATDVGAVKRSAVAVGTSSNAAVTLSGTLTEQEGKRLLDRIGIPVTRERFAETPADAERIAHELGDPVVLKIVSPDIQHKSDVGGVRLDVPAGDVREQAVAMLTEVAKHVPHAKLTGVLVQEMLRDGIEIFIGVQVDEQFGPIVVTGLGGILIEVFDDVSMRRAPVGHDEARRMVEELRSYPILNGARGKHYDVDALVDAIVKVAAFADQSRDNLVELDINPIVVFPRGHGVCAADAVMRFH